MKLSGGWESCSPNTPGRGETAPGAAVQTRLEKITGRLRYTGSEGTTALYGAAQFVWHGMAR